MPGVQPTDREWEAAMAVLEVVKVTKTADELYASMNRLGFADAETKIGCGMVLERSMRNEGATDEEIEEAFSKYKHEAE